MDKNVILCTLIIFAGVTFIKTQSDDYESTRKYVLSYLKLNDDATVENICNGLQRVLESELELQKKNGQSGVLPPNDPNHLWIRECDKQDVTMENLLNLLKKQGEINQS